MLMSFISDIFDLRLVHFGTLAFVAFVLWLSFLIRNKWLGIRLIPLLLLGILVPIASIEDIVFVFVPIMIFTMYIIISDSYTVNQDEYTNMRGVAVTYIALTGFVSLLIQGTGAGYLGAALVCGIMLARDLRHDIATLKQPGYVTLNLSILGILLGAAFFAGTGMMRQLMTLIFNGIRWLYFTILGRVEEIDIEWFELPDYEVYMEAGVGEVEAVIDPYAEVVEVTLPGWLAAIGITVSSALVTVLIIVVALGIWVARKIFIAFGKQGGDQDLHREYIGYTTKKKEKSDKLSGNNGLIRRYYKRFMKYISRNTVNIKPSHTTHDLQTITQNILGENTQDLREVYIRARYSNKEITQDDALQARDAYRRFRNGSKQK